MLQLPHTFPTLRQEADGSGATRRCVAVVGAGFSHGLVPTADSLFDEKRKTVEASLGCTGSEAATDLGLWAGEIIRQLQQRNGEVPPKLLLAEALGITTDPRWRGANRDGPVEPRHRVVARFAREDRLDSLWLLNWDCLQENALERVGLSRSAPRADLPWKTQFRTFVTVADYDRLGAQQSLDVFKPHGCVHSLTDARAALDDGKLDDARRLSNRFLITAAELQVPKLDSGQTQAHLFAQLVTRLAKVPLIALGWRAAEGYLCRLVEQQVVPALRQRQLVADELSIVDISFNSEGHQRLAAAYRRTQAQAYVEVEKKGFTLDALWLWLQALYSVQHLRAYKPSSKELDSAFDALQAPCTGHWVVLWADEWLTGWCRLCWRFGCVTCIHNNKLVPPEELDLEAEDAHVPINLPNTLRPDLVAAGSLLATLWIGTQRWDFRMFPGALFEATQGQLVLPVPTWPSRIRDGERALKPLVELWRPRLGIIRRLSLLGLDGGQQAAASAIEHWRQALVRILPVSRFAGPQKIATFHLQQL